MEKADSKDWEDTKLIECAICHKPLNGETLYVTCEAEPKTLCVRCQEKGQVLEVSKSKLD